jgi:hypothetical protein
LAITAALVLVQQQLAFGLAVVVGAKALWALMGHPVLVGPVAQV